MNVPNDDHPMHRTWSPEDPMSLEAAPVDGDPAVMLECLIEEYLRQGSSESLIMSLFRTPDYQATYGLLKLFGEKHVLERVREATRRMGALRCTVVCYDEDPCDQDQQISG